MNIQDKIEMRYEKRILKAQQAIKGLEKALWIVFVAYKRYRSTLHVMSDINADSYLIV